jgi:hypothetical protein
MYKRRPVYAGSMNHALLESATFTKAFIALIPACMLLWGSTVQYFRWKKTASTLLQLLGAGCLVVVVVTHTFEALDVMPRIASVRRQKSRSLAPRLA